MFASGSEEYKMKLSYADIQLAWDDLISICNVLAIDYSDTKKELSQRVCGYLLDLNSLNKASNDDRDKEDIKDDDVNDDDSIDEGRRKRQKTHTLTK